MNRRISVIIFAALLLSICASFLVYRAAGARMSPAQKTPAVELVLAARDLVPGMLAQDIDLKMAAWPGPLPKGAIRILAGALNRGVVSPIYEGEAVTELRLSSKGSGGGLAATIPLGMRACAVKVNEVVGVAGFVVPGMRVDVLITGLPPGANGIEGPRVRTLLQNIEVLSAGTNFLKDREGKPEQAQVVNLLVTPVQAEALSLAGNETHIQLVLRNPMDTEIARPPGTILSNLFSDAGAAVRSAGPRGAGKTASPPLSVANGPKVYSIEVLNGPVHTLARFTRPAETP